MIGKGGFLQVPLHILEKNTGEPRGRLFFSGVEGLANENRIREAKISLIVSVMSPSKADLKFLAKDSKLGPQIDWLKIPVEDLETSDISRHFRQATTRMAGHLFGGRNVLVHCEKGRSRAPTLVIAFLIRFFHASFEECQGILQKIDSSISPNFGFRVQLKEYEKFLKIKERLENPAEFPSKLEIKDRAKLEAARLTPPLEIAKSGSEKTVLIKKFPGLLSGIASGSSKVIGLFSSQN